MNVLFEAFNGLLENDALDELAALGFEFNESLLHFLPKKAVGATDEGVAVCSVSATRPLNVVNADNRILASAVLLMLEPALAPSISRDQRGFLQGRSTLPNAIDVEEVMCIDAIDCPDALAFFMDFEAAFPSVEHGFLLVPNVRNLLKNVPRNL